MIKTEHATQGDAAADQRWVLALPVLVPAAVSALVVLPMAGKGWVFLLDWARGPHVGVPRSFWGLDGGLLAAVPFTALSVVLGWVTGPATLTWLPIAAGLFAAGVSMGRLVGGPPWRQVPAGALYAVNPFVFERVYAGQVAFVLAYGLLPFAVASLLRAEKADAWVDRLRPALWITALVALATHFAWMVAVICLVLLIARRSRRTLAWLAGLALVTVVTNAYLLVSSVGRPVPLTVGTADLASFRTVADDQLGLFANVGLLHGFWRLEVPLPKDEVPGFLLFMLAIVLVAAAGARAAWLRRDTRLLAVVAAACGVLGLVLAVGDQGPTGAVYRRLFLHLPGFAIMREPQKFAALLALGYAVLFGFGAEQLVERTRRAWARRTWTVAGVLLPLAATSTLFWGLSGHLRPVSYPPSWEQADRLMGDGPGKVLFLPWHQYLSFPFTGRIVANPAPMAFRRDTIAGDNVELRRVATTSTSTRSAYLEFLFQQGPELRSFGQMTAPLGVEYVVLAKTVDWERYRWLDDQDDLEPVLEDDDLVVYRNERPTSGDGRRAARVSTVADWGEVVGLSEAADLSQTVLAVRRHAAGPVRLPARPVPPPDEGPAPPGGDVQRRSEVAYAVGAGRPGVVALAEPFDPTWQLGEADGFELAGGTVGFRTDGSPATARFGHWPRVRIGYALSALACAALLTARFLGPRLGPSADGEE